jgi:hypothetical protein
MQRLFYLLAITSLLHSCKKANRPANGGEVELYLLQSSQMLPSRCEVNSATAVLQNKPLVTNDDILEYSDDDHTFRFKDKSHEKIKALMDRTPFAVTLNKRVVYYGIFKPSFSSSSCDHSITMDVSWSATDRVSLRLGYPGPMQGVTITDNRNDPALLLALKEQGKLR